MNETMAEGAIKVIQGMIGLLVGGDAMDMIDELIVIYDDKDMSKDEKRKEVKAVVMPFVRIMGKELVNIAIAIAVTLLRSKLASMQKKENT